ncbi:MAG TPA: TonB family protein [Opitutaceae bacterium]|nr:TonB family protein [Opitutaceae bacterium]
MKSFKAYRWMFLSVIAIASLVADARGTGFWLGYRYSVSVAFYPIDSRAAGYLEPLSMPLPIYPPELMRAGVSGASSIRFSVSREGRVEQVEVTGATLPAFADAAKLAVKQWAFSLAPAAKNSTFPTVVECRFRFGLSEDKEEKG